VQESDSGDFAATIRFLHERGAFCDRSKWSNNLGITAKACGSEVSLQDVLLSEDK